MMHFLARLAFCLALVPPLALASPEAEAEDNQPASPVAPSFVIHGGAILRALPDAFSGYRTGYRLGAVGGVVLGAPRDHSAAVFPVVRLAVAGTLDLYPGQEFSRSIGIKLNFGSGLCARKRVVCTFGGFQPGLDLAVPEQGGPAVASFGFGLGVGVQVLEIIWIDLQLESAAVRPAIEATEGLAGPGATIVAGVDFVPAFRNAFAPLLRATTRARSKSHQP